MVKYNIRYGSSSPSKIYDVNDLEELFFEKLFSKTQEVNLNNNFSMIRMSNGTLAVEYAGYPIGKVRLQGKKHTMQILKSIYKYYSVEGNIQDFLPKIDEWIQYIRKYILKELKGV